MFIRIGCLLAVIVSLLTTAYVTMILLLGLGVYTWRSEVPVMEIVTRSPNEITLIVASCNRDPQVSMLRETNVEVEVRVVADSNAFMRGWDDCQDLVDVQLREPLGDRTVVNKHYGIFDIRNVTRPKSFFPR